MRTLRDDKVRRLVISLDAIIALESPFVRPLHDTWRVDPAGGPPTIPTGLADVLGAGRVQGLRIFAVIASTRQEEAAGDIPDNLDQLARRLGVECQGKKNTYTNAAPFVAKPFVIVFNSETFGPIQANVHGIRTFASEVLVITELDIADTNLGRNVNGACR